jgi:RES domain-containing protein
VIFWRISNYETLDGAGGLEAEGRWHTAGRRIVYCAPNPATALLEVLVHFKIDLDGAPVSFRYLEIEAPDNITEEAVDSVALGSDWRGNQAVTQRCGDEWLESGQSALFLVPSVIVPATWNVLLNPLHPQSEQIRLVKVHRHAIDRRLFR